MPVFGPASTLKKEANFTRADGYSPFVQPGSEETSPPPYMPGPISSLLSQQEQDDAKTTKWWYRPYGMGMQPTTTWADVQDQQTRAQQRRERGTAVQPRSSKRAEQQAAMPAAPPAVPTQDELARAAAAARVQAAKAKTEQAQRDRAEREQIHGQARERVGQASSAVDKAEQRLKDAKSDLEDWLDKNGSGTPPSDIQDAIDSAQSDLENARKALDAAKSAEQQAAEAVTQAVASEDTALRDLQQAETEQQAAEQKQQQAEQAQAAQPQPEENPYGSPEPGAGLTPGTEGAPQPEPPDATAGAQPPQAAPRDPIAEAIAQVQARGGTADDLLDAIAAAAWRQQSGRQGPNWMDPEDVKAYDQYRASWVGAYRAGQDVPLANELRGAGGQNAAPQDQAQAPSPEQVSATTEPQPSPAPAPMPGAEQPSPIGLAGEPPAGGPVGSVLGATSPSATAPGSPAGAPAPGTPTTPVPGVPTGAAAAAQETLAAAQARDAQIQRELRAADKDADAARKRLEAAQEKAKDLSKEASLGIGSPEYRQYSLAPALNQAQGAVSDAAYQLSQAQARASQARQMLASSQQSIAAAQNLVGLAGYREPTSANVGGPAGSTARQASEAAEAGKLLDTLLANASPEQRARIADDIARGGQAGTEVLRKIAAAAWARQVTDQGGQATGAPPRDYVESWMGMYRAGQENAPLIAALRAELAKRQRGGALDPRDAGVVPPSNNGPATSVLPRNEMLRMSASERKMYDEWVRAGGSGKWEDFAVHAQAVGAPPVGPRRVYLDPRDAGVLTPGQTGRPVERGGAMDARDSTIIAPQASGPTTSVLPPAGNPDSSSEGGPMSGPLGQFTQPASNPDSSSGEGPMSGPQTELDAYIAMKRQAGDARSDEELRAEYELTRPTGNGPVESALPDNGPPPVTSTAVPTATATSTVVPTATSEPTVEPTVSPTSEPTTEPTATATAAATGTPTTKPVAAGAPLAPIEGETSPRGGPAGVPVQPRTAGAEPADPLMVDTGPESTDPIEVSGRAVGVTDEAGQSTIANGIAAWARGDMEGAWAQMHVDNAARLAWWIQAGKPKGYGPKNAPQSYINAWKKNWLAGDESSPLQAEMNSALQKWGLRSLGHTPGSTGYDWRQVYGAVGERLAPRQLTGNDCGPTAAVAFGRAIGLDPDQRKVFEWARQRGYHNGVEFQGTGAMQKMLADMGIKSEVGGVDWTRIDQELATGRPVMLSGRGHYWLLSGKDPNTGAYYTGATGEAVREGVWEKPNQFRFQGGVNQAVYLVDTNNPAGSAMVQAGVAGVATPTPVARSGYHAVEPTSTPAPEPQAGDWTPELGSQIGQENPFGPSPVRTAAMQQFQARPYEARQAIFERSIQAGLDAEGISDPTMREALAESMRLVATGPSAENKDLNPYEMNSQFGGVPRRPESGAFGYFQFLGWHPNGTFDPERHIQRFSPAKDPGNLWDPVNQTRMYIRAVFDGRARGDPWYYPNQKKRQGWWGP